MSTREWEKNIRRVTPYVPGEQPHFPDMIKLNTNENPYPPSPELEQLLKQMKTEELRLYPDPEAKLLVRELASFYQVQEENIFVGVGSDDVLAMAFLTFFHSGKPILFPDITYSFYDVWAELFHIPYERPALMDDFTIRISDYYKENGGIVIANPNAPTSLALGLDDLEDIVVHNPDVIVIIDEAYIDFGGCSALPLIEKYENLLVVQTCSKSRSLAGMRIGYAMGQDRLIKALNDVKSSYNSYTMNQTAIKLGAAAIRDREYFEARRSQLIATRTKVEQELRKLGFHFPESKTNFLFITHERISAKELFHALRKQHIFVRYFEKPRIDNYLRVSIGTEEEMKVFLDFLTKYCHEIMMSDLF